jgi:hypothetical protein
MLLYNYEKYNELTLNPIEFPPCRVEFVGCRWLNRGIHLAAMSRR